MLLIVSGAFFARSRLSARQCAQAGHYIGVITQTIELDFSSQLGPAQADKAR
jgi:hypothetical protein